MSRFFCLLFLSVALLSCGPNFVYEETHELTSGVWHYDKPLGFSFDIKDTTQLYNLHLVLAHSPEFNYQNMYVKIKTTFPNSETLEEEVSLELADKFGQWLGHCGGESCELAIVIQQKAYFNQLGKHEIAIEQWTRDEALSAIQSLTFKLEALEEHREN